MYQLMPSLSELHCSYNTPFTHSLWYLKYSLCRRKQSEPESPSVLSGTFRSSDEEKQQRLTSNHVTTNHPNMSACVTRWCVGFLICKKKKEKKRKSATFCEVFDEGSVIFFWSSLSKKLFDYSAVIYGARLPSVETKITDKLFTIPAE